MTKTELLEEIESLSAVVREQNLSDAKLEKAPAEIRELRRELEGEKAYDPSRLAELKGLGKEIWQAIDVDEYLRQE